MVNEESQCLNHYGSLSHYQYIANSLTFTFSVGCSTYKVITIDTVTQTPSTVTVRNKKVERTLLRAILLLALTPFLSLHTARAENGQLKWGGGGGGG